MDRIIMMAACAALALTSAYSQENSTAKNGNTKATLSFLTLLPFDGQSGQLAWPACNEAIRIAIDYANEHENILPGYHLVQQIENEGPSALLANVGLVKYYRRNDAYYKSPVIFGPSIACQTVGLTTRMMHFTSFSEQCAGPYIVARKKFYSTQYSAQTYLQYGVLAMFATIKLIGQWNQFAMVTNANNPNEYMFCPMLQDLANKAAMQVLYYANEFDITADTIAALKASNARIIVVSVVQLPFSLKVLCLAHAAGMRPPMHIFIFNSFLSMFDPYNPAIPVPNGCSREALAQQLKGTIYAGLYIGRIGIDNQMKTTFGYDVQFFDQQFSTNLNGQKTPDYDFRYLCHDAAMAAIMTLNRSESVLKSVYNRTLKDFDTEPELVGSVVNATASTLDFKGIRLDRFSYSRSGELNEDLWIGQVEGGQAKMWYRMKRLPGQNDYNSLSNYQLIEVNKPQWPTKSGRPPKDLSEIVHLTSDCGTAAISAVVSIFFLFTSGQSALLVISLKKHSEPDHYGAWQKVLLFFGCICLNTSAVVLLVGSDHFTVVECQIRPVLTTIGISLVNSFLFMQIFAFAKLRNLGNMSRVGPQYWNTSVLTVGGKHVAMRGFDRRPQQVANVVGTAVTSEIAQRSFRTSVIIVVGESLLSSFSILIMVVWVFYDPLSVVISFSPVQFNDKLDSYFDVRSTLCASPFQTYWLIALLVYHTVLLIVGCFLAYTSTCRLVASQGKDKPCQFFRFAVGNATILFLGILLIALILSTTKIACGSVGVVAFGELIFSASTFCIILMPTVFHSNHNDDTAH